jgi:ribosomal protein L12E/L44/L45/RPP1/RPP2
MTDREHARKLEELDRLLNDPDVSMDPARVWSLLAELSGRDTAGSAGQSNAQGVASFSGAAD